MNRIHCLTMLGALPIAGRTSGVASAATRLRIATPPITAAAQPYFARANGYFTKAGIDADISFMPSGAATAAAVVAGALDVGNSNAISLASAHDRGVPLVYIAPDALYDSAHPVAALIVSRQSQLTNAKDLNGKTVAVNALKNLPHLATMAWIDKNGGDSATVKFVEVPLPAVPAALTAGRIDAGVCSEPFLTAALSGDARMFANCYEALAKQFMYGGFFTTAQWAQDHPGVVRDFRSAIIEASRWANMHQAEARDILLRDAKLDVSALMSHDVYATRLDPELLQPLINIAARYGVIRTPFPVSDMISRI